MLGETLRSDAETGLAAGWPSGAGRAGWSDLWDFAGLVESLLISKKAFVSALLNGLTLAGLYFLLPVGSP
jgi:hypothetical protein